MTHSARFFSSFQKVTVCIQSISMEVFAIIYLNKQRSFICWYRLIIIHLLQFINFESWQRSKNKFHIGICVIYWILSDYTISISTWPCWPNMHTLLPFQIFWQILIVSRNFRYWLHNIFRSYSILLTNLSILICWSIYVINFNKLTTSLCSVIINCITVLFKSIHNVKEKLYNFN